MNSVLPYTLLMDFMKVLYIYKTFLRQTMYLIKFSYKYVDLYNPTFLLS
jgi:hypothetical protein